MMDETGKSLEQNELITIKVDNKTHAVKRGHTVATAISSIKGFDNYRKTRFGDRRAPVCNMGVCFECSVYIEGKGNVRACMTETREGMSVLTNPDFAGLSISESNQPNGNQEYSRHPVPNQSDVFDVAIIGSGPAGLGAAEELSNHGVQVVVLDEQQHSGGQIYRHIPESFHSKNKKSVPNILVKRADAWKDIKWMRGRSVWSINSYREDGVLSSSEEEHDAFHILLENSHPVKAEQIIIATGAYDHIIPFKGWTKPGVMSAGGIQIFAKTQQYLPGEEVLLVGSHPFLLIVAKQILEAGGRVKGIAFSQSLPKINEFFTYGFEGLKRWKKSKEMIHALQTLKKHKVPIWFRYVPVLAEGESKIEQVYLSKMNKDGSLSEENKMKISCDLLGVCYGFNASSELPRQLNCQIRYDEVSGGQLVEVDEHMKSSNDNVFVAGELNGIGGAELSEIEGRIAGLSVLQTIKPGLSKNNSKRLGQLQKERKSWVSFARMLGEASKITFDFKQTLEREPETYICRCEEISYKHLKDVLHKHPNLTSLNAIKLQTRCGMGLCQGRYCERSLYSIVEQNPQNQEFFSARFPVKPITIQDLINNYDSFRE